MTQTHHHHQQLITDQPRRFQLVLLYIWWDQHHVWLTSLTHCKTKYISVLHESYRKLFFKIPTFPGTQFSHFRSISNVPSSNNLRTRLILNGTTSRLLTPTCPWMSGVLNWDRPKSERWRSDAEPQTLSVVTSPLHGCWQITVYKHETTVTYEPSQQIGGGWRRNYF